MDLKIASLNVRGIGNKEKRREMFNWLRAKQFSIYLLQETHCTNNLVQRWTTEWGYQSLFSCCTGSKAGVSILFNNNFAFQIIKTFTDPSGRFLICDVKTNNICVTIANLYAPNDDDKLFFSNFFDHLSDFQCDDIVIGGDFNLVLDVEKDKKGGLAKTHKQSAKIVQNAVAELDLVDIWRAFNPDVRKYSWRRKTPEIHCRLDFFLVNQSVATITKSADIVPGYKTDHSMITLYISLHSNQRGKGFWKLNTSLLSDNEYVKKIKATICQTKTCYENDPTVSPALLWEMIKLKVRESSLSYSAMKKKTVCKKQDELEKEIANLEIELSNLDMAAPGKIPILEKLEAKREAFEKLVEYRTKGAVLRSKSVWYNEGEKNTKYFLSLEKRHFKQGTISQLKINEQDFVFSDKEILAECESFYSKLYTSQGNSTELETSNFFFSKRDNRLNDEQQKVCEGDLTKKECLEALNDMEADKSPGTDGLPAEFYKFFWNDISDTLIKALNYGYEVGQLSVTQRRGVIKLLPKKDTIPHFIKNWRPISLLNCDYKIATKAIANRIKKVIPNVINQDQTGFIKGRFIGENIRLIDSLIKYSVDRNIPGLLLFLDFEKAFDTLEWHFIRKALQHFGFGQSLINWVNVFYSSAESCVLNNGWASNLFRLSRGVRQGCPLSPYLFIISAEVLANAIRENPSVKGITVNKTEIKLSQYADDTTLTLDGSERSFQEALRMLEFFEKASGLRLNHQKTEAFWIGSKSKCDDVFSPEKNLKWPKLKVKALGVWFSNDPQLSISLNLLENLEQVRKCLNSWSLRRLSLIGKIVVLKSLAASQLVYVLTSLQFKEFIIKEINKLFYEFVWDGRGDKIKRKVMINDFNDGGLRMLDIESFNKALKCSWIKKYLDDNNKGKWKLFMDMELECSGKLLLTCNLSKKDFLTRVEARDPFFREIINVWTEVNFEPLLKSIEHFNSQILWLNSLFKIDNKIFFYKDWFSNGVIQVKDLLKDENTFFSFREFKEKFNFTVCPLTYCGVISMLKKAKRLIVNNSTEIVKYESISSALRKTEKASQLVYKILVDKKSVLPNRSQEKWQTDCNCYDINWKGAYLLSRQCTKSSKLIEFQFKLLHRRLPTNFFLQKIGLKDNGNCSFCGDEPDTLIHLFWTCNKTQLFWKEVVVWLKECDVVRETYSLKMITALGLKPDTSNFKLQINYCLLLARFFVWCCKVKEKGMSWCNFKRILKRNFEIETTAPQNKLELKKWNPLSLTF